MTITFETSRLALAAFALESGAELIGYTLTHFEIKSGKKQSEWEAEFKNSVADKFNRRLVSLQTKRKELK